MASAHNPRLLGCKPHAHADAAVSVVLESSTTSEISLIPHVAFIVYEVARESESVIWGEHWTFSNRKDHSLRGACTKSCSGPCSRVAVVEATEKSTAQEPFQSVPLLDSFLL